MNEVTLVDTIKKIHWPEMGGLPNRNDERPLGKAKFHVPSYLTG